MALNGKKPVLILAALAAVLMVAISVTGMVLDDGGHPYVFSTMRGEAVDVYGGQGLYRYDSVEKAVMGRGFDWVNLIVGLPLLIVGVHLYLRGQLRGQLLLAASFFYLTYNYLIAMVGTAFNVLFLVYVALSWRSVPLNCSRTLPTSGPASLACSC